MFSDAETESTFETAEAARAEALAIFADLARDIFVLTPNSEWRWKFEDVMETGLSVDAFSGSAGKGG
jgi:hypothetical protein